METGTVLSVDIKYPDGDHQISSIEVNAWDLDMEKLFDLFKRLLGAMGFSGVEEYFERDESIYSEEIPREDFVELAPTPEGKTLAEVFAYERSDWPCMFCLESCEDTACLINRNRTDTGDDDRLW